MKIAVISRGTLSHKGGAERFTLSFCMELVKMGHSITVYSPEVFENNLGIRSIKVNFLKTISFLKILSFNWAVKRLIQKADYDIIYGHCQCYPLDVYYAGGGVHKLWMNIRYENKVLRMIKYITSPVHIAMVWMEKKIFADTNNRYIVTNSKLVKSHIISSYNFPEEQIKVIYDGIDQDVFNFNVRSERSFLREKYCIQKEDVVVFFASNNWERKGLETILLSLKKLPEKYKVVVAGRGNIKKFSNIINEGNLSKRVILLGVIKDIQKYYGMADVFVLPTMYDPFAQVCREALACGVPVITTKMNGACEIIQDGFNGFVLDSWRDYPKLSNFLLNFDDESKRIIMSKNSIDTVKNCSWSENSVVHVNIFNKIIEQKISSYKK